MIKKKRLLVCLLCLALVGYAQAYSPEYDENGELTLLRADLNRDGYFNMVDISLFASAWLEQDCGLSNPCEGADVYPPGGDSVIDLRDFAVTAEDYGRCTDPTNPDCIHLPLTLFEPPSGTAVSFSGSHNGGPSSSPPVGNVDASFDPLNIPYPGYGGPGGGGGSGVIGSGIAFYLSVPAGQAVGSYDGNLDYSLSEGSNGGGGGGSGDIFDNIENFQMAGNLVLTSEPDDPGLLGSSNSPYWRYGGYATGLAEGGGVYVLHVAVSGKFYGIWDGFWEAWGVLPRIRLHGA